jgi:hypothetical protein
VGFGRYDPFSCIIHKEGLYLSTGEINSLIIDEDLSVFFEITLEFMTILVLNKYPYRRAHKKIFTKKNPKKRTGI